MEGWKVGYRDRTALAHSLMGENSEIVVDLNPQMADNNVRLVGCLTAEGFAGKWQYATLIGVVAEGPFLAVR